MEKNKGILVSIVVLNYNGLAYLKSTIPAILKLDFPNYELIVVDNFSKDGSVNFLKKFKKVRLIQNKENLGYSKGKNIGVKNAKGKYIVLLDNDILLKDDGLVSKLISFYKKEHGFIQIPILDKGKNKTSYYGLFFSLYGPNLHKKEVELKKIMDVPKDSLPISSPTGGFIFCERDKWKKIGGFDESQPVNLDDVDIGPRAWILGYSNYLYLKSYAVHLGVNNKSSIETYSKWYRFLFSGHARSIIKNYRLSNLLLTLPLLFLFNFSKTIKYSIKKRSLKIFFSFIYSINMLLDNLPDTLRKRKEIQSKRIMGKDIFLKIKAPKFK